MAARGIATVRPEVSDGELADLQTTAGVRGVRFNFVSPPRRPQTRQLLPPPGPNGSRHLGWHIVVYFEAADLAERWDLFTALPTVVVVDHMGGPTSHSRWTVRVRTVPAADGRSSERLVKVTCPERSPLVGRHTTTSSHCATHRRAVPRSVLWARLPHPNLSVTCPMTGGCDFIPE